MVRPDQGATHITSRIAQASPQVYARVAGLLYLLIAIVSPFSFFYMRARLIVPGDATATAGNIMASEWLFRLAIMGDAVVFLCEVVLIALLYHLLRPVSQSLTLVTVFARLGMAVLQAVNLLNYFVVLLLLSGAGYLTVFEADQLHALALVFLTAYADVALIWGDVLWPAFHPACLSRVPVGLLPQGPGRPLGRFSRRLSHPELWPFPAAPIRRDLCPDRDRAGDCGGVGIHPVAADTGVNVAKWEQRARESA
jgi:hypothetical protein